MFFYIFVQVNTLEQTFSISKFLGNLEFLQNKFYNIDNRKDMGAS